MQTTLRISLAMQLKKINHGFCLMVYHMESQITIGQINPSFRRILAAHSDFRPEEIIEIDKVFSCFDDGGCHTLLLLLRAQELT
jgi:hypothetical protein